MSKQMEERVKLGGGKPPPPIQVAPSLKTSGSGGIQVASEFRSMEMSSPDNGAGNMAAADQQMSQQLQTILHLLKNHAQPDQVKFNKKVLSDFDYSDEEDNADTDQTPSPAMREALQG